MPLPPDPVRWARIETVLDEVLARDPREWPTLLNERCDGDVQLRAEVESLLRVAEPARRFLDSPPAISAAAFVAETIAQPNAVEAYEGRRVGAYRIVRELGRGGMSYVFLAERADGGYTHEVALKLLRPGLDTEIDQERFRAERQILASLNHPNIARLLDGGATEDGRPYLVIEHVDGTAIDSYADEHRLGVRERVALFRTVCQATQYAHRNLVVHRDLKPSNIFVDRDGVVKLLDFGLAKLLEPGRAGPNTMRRWMTPEYAAPEQIRGEAVTTLTDVYQLGAALYELLAGVPPFQDQGDSIHSLEQAVLGDEPEPPSSAAARNGRGNAASEIRGDLDAIVLKALHKEPEERFDSVAALDRDLGAWASGHPVQARRGNAWYRARRFVRRHRVETVAVTSITLTLVAAVGISLSAARRADAARDRAESASRESEAVSSFLLRLFEASDPAEAQGDTLTAVELVRRAALRAEAMRGTPAAQARMLEATAQLQHSLGHFGEENVLLRRALELRRQVRPVDELALAGTLRLMARSLVILRQAERADSALREALALQQSLGADQSEVAGTIRQLASVAVARGDIRQAEEHVRHALAINERSSASGDSSVAASRLLLGSVLRRKGRLDEAEQEYRQALAIYERVLGAENPSVAETILHVAYLAETQGRYAEAEMLIRRALEMRRKIFGNAHPMVAHTLGDLANTLGLKGDITSAIETDREYLRSLRAAYGPAHPGVAAAMHQLGNHLHKAGRLDEAETFYRESIAIRERLFGAEDEGNSGAHVDLALLLADRGDYASAKSLITVALRRHQRALGVAHPTVAIVEARLGMLFAKTGGYHEADSLLQHARAILERQTSRRDPDLRQVYGYLADLETARKRPAEAAKYRAIANGR
jgi:serine/threonine-protein kinase